MEHDHNDRGNVTNGTAPGACGCQGAHSGGATFDHGTSTWKVLKPCTYVPPPEGVEFRCDFAAGHCDTECAFTGVEVWLEDEPFWNATLMAMDTKPVWRYADGASKCMSPSSPMNTDSIQRKARVTTSADGLRQERRYEYLVKCAVGFSSASRTGPRFDKDTHTWRDECIHQPLPDPKARHVYASNSSMHKDHTQCMPGYHAQAPYHWFPGIPEDSTAPLAGWKKHDEFVRLRAKYMPNDPMHIPSWVLSDATLQSECRPNKDGFNYTCFGGYCKAIMVPPPSGVTIEHGRDEHGEEVMHAGCDRGLEGTVTFTRGNDNVNGTWSAACSEVIPPCPPGSIREGDACSCDWKTHVGPGYNLTRHGGEERNHTGFAGTFVEVVDGLLSGCEKRACPRKSRDANEGFPEKPLKCVCMNSQATAAQQPTMDSATGIWNVANCPATNTPVCPDTSYWDHGELKCKCPGKISNIERDKQAMYDCRVTDPSCIVDETRRKAAMAAAKAETEWRWFGTCSA